MSALPQEVVVGWRLRPMNPERIPEVVAIEHRAYRFPWSEAVFRDCLRVGYSAWMMLDESDALIGYALMSMAVGEAHVLNLCVAPERQRQGLGRVLLCHLLDLARAGGLHIVLLEVRRSNKAALALYRGHGFMRIGLRRGYYPDVGGREDAFVLAYDIH